MKRTWLWALTVLVLASPLVAAKANEATVSPPIDLTGAELEAPGGPFTLADGDDRLLLSVPLNGFANVQRERTSCLSNDPSTCVPSTMTTSTSRIDLGTGSVTFRPREDDSSPTYTLSGTLAEGGTTALLSAPEVRIALDPATAQAQMTSGEPWDWDWNTETGGPLVVASEGTQIAFTGALVVEPLDATVDLVDFNKRTHTVHVGARMVADGVRYTREVSHVTINAEGALAGLWNGVVGLAPYLPLTFAATTAQMDIDEGTLAGEGPGGDIRIDALEATLLEVQGGNTFIVTDATQAAQTPQGPDVGLPGAVLVGSGVAVAGLLAGLGYFWPRMSWGLTVLALPMYSRIEKNDLFDNDIREKLYQLIQQTPGIHAHGLAERADVGWGTTVYHLRLLERNRLVTSERAGRYRRFFPAAGYLARRREVLSVLQNDTTNAIARFVLKLPGSNQKALCEALTISPSLANWHLNRLLDAGLVSRERRGRTVHYFPGEAWREVDAVAE